MPMMSMSNDFDTAEGAGNNMLSSSGRHQWGMADRMNSFDRNGDDSAAQSGGGGDDNIHVVIRVRPPNSSDSGKSSVQITGEQTVVVDTEFKSRQSRYDRVFDGSASQQDVFDNCGIKHMIDMALAGYSSTAFAFGQTGSGKTHTITGPPELSEGLRGDRRAYGLIPRAIGYLYKSLPQNGPTFRITASYLEIYNEQVMDLLNPAYRSSLPVRWSKQRGFYVENLFVVECETADDLTAVLEEGLRNRQTGSNSVNEHSSRSHSILTIYVDSEEVVGGEGEGGVTLVKSGKLAFVDLAGSEKTQLNLTPTGEQMAESANINRSLLVLGNCISALGDPKKKHAHIPYRDSKLTKLLSDSLGGNGLTLMIACISPAGKDASETANTLRYANRARNVKTKPVVRMDPKAMMVASLSREVQRLTKENEYLRRQLTSQQGPRDAAGKGGTKGVTAVGGGGGGGGVHIPGGGRGGSASVVTNGVDSGLQEMLQEYMVENEKIRRENADLQRRYQQMTQDHQMISTENERLQRKVDSLQRSHPSTPLSIYSVDSISSRRSFKSDRSDLEDVFTSPGKQRKKLPELKDSHGAEPSLRRSRSDSRFVEPRHSLGTYRQLYTTQDITDGLTRKNGAALQPIPTLQTSPSNSFHRESLQSMNEQLRAELQRLDNEVRLQQIQLR